MVSEGTLRGLVQRAAVLLFLLLLLLLTTVAVLAVGCGAQKTAIPSALDAEAIDITAEPGPAGLPPRSTGVPAGYILEMCQSIARDDGAELHSQRWWDFENDRFRWDTFGDPASMLGGSTTTANDPAVAHILYAAVWAEGQTLSYDAASGELRGGPAGKDDVGTETWDEWPNSDDVVLLGRQMLKGVKADVYRLDLNVGRGQERSADFGLIYAEAATGRRLREEWLLGPPEDAWVYHLYEYRLAPRTSELEARLTPQALLDLAAETVAEHLHEVAALDFPVWGLPTGIHGLTLAGVTIMRGDRGIEVRVAYAPEDRRWAPAVWIETTDVRNRPDFPQHLLMSREEAVTGAAGSDHIDFRMRGSDAGAGDSAAGTGYDTSVRILLSPDSSSSSLDLGGLAMELIDARELAQ